MSIKYLLLFVLTLSLLGACSGNEPETSLTDRQVSGESAISLETENMPAATTENPFLSTNPLPFQYPRFDLIELEHYLPAFEQGMQEQLAEIDAIANQSDAPTFTNTMIPLELSGRLLNRVASVFFSMTSAHTNEGLNAIEVEIAPRLSEHNDQIFLNEALFNRIYSLYQQRDSLGLDPESLRLVEETYKSFIRAGAELNEDAKQRLRNINTELAELSTRFGQNVLNEVNAVAVVVEDAVELAGLSDAEIQAAADEAASRNMPGKYVIPLLNTSGQPSLTKLENRALRQRIYETSLSRGHRGGEYDNREILSRTVELRAEKAELLGFPTYADYSLQEQTAQTLAAVNQRLAELVPPAVANARREAADLQAMIDAEGGDFELAAWDWAYYAEKVRQERYQFDENQLRPYFEVNNVMFNGVFYAATQIYGIRFQERFDLPVYQEDVRVFDVWDQDGTPLAIFIMDLYARPANPEFLIKSRLLQII